MGLLGDRLGQQTTLVIADIARRCADQPRYRVPFHVLGHVEAQQFDPHDMGQLTRHLGLADAGGAGEQEAADRLVRRLEPGAGQLDRRRQAVDGLILTEHQHLEIAIQVLEQLAIGAGHALRRNPRDGSDHRLDLIDVDGVHAHLRRQQALVGTGLIDDIDGLVRQEAVVDVAIRQPRGAVQRGVGVLELVVLLEA